MKTLWISLIAAGALCAQAAKDANAGYKTPEGRASVAATLTDAGRDARQKPKELVAALQITSGSTVIDLGTGPGYMLPFLSAAVGPTGQVIAEDIETDFIEKARAKAKQDGLANVEFILGSDTDPKLPAAAADLILVLDAYHHFDYPDKMLASLKAALKPGGRLAIVEYHKRRGAMGGADSDRALTHIRATNEQVAKEVEAAGFKLLSERDHIPNSQYIALFRRLE
jgi:ubiquinone/menaquinone biosynthesis C-methylase UbiE